jgi:hypothetical protein
MLAPSGVHAASYFTVGANAVPDRSRRGASALMPAGFVTIVAASSGTAADTPPIEFWTGPKPIMRMPLVAAAGAAAASAAVAIPSLSEKRIIVPSGEWIPAAHWAPSLPTLSSNPAM